MPIIRRLDGNDCPEAAELLARAFHEDSFFRTCIPDPDIRRRHLPPFFEACLRYGVLYGRVYGAGRPGHGLEGVGWWYRYPEDYFDEVRTQLVGFGEVSELLGVGSDAIERISGRIDAVMARTVPEPRANLDQIGVDPVAQGRGLGSALVQHIVADAQADGLPVALWTDAKSSVQFYERNGFHVAGHGDQADHEIDWWVMFRNLQSE